MNLSDARPVPFVAPARRRLSRRAAVVGAAAVALFVGGGLGLGAVRATSPGPAPAQAAGVFGGDLAARAVADASALGAGIARLQARLAEDPASAADWAALGGAYVQQARITVDPAYYPKAEGALKRSLELQPAGNLAALVGLGTLANARHDFAGAVSWATRARAVSSYNPQVYGVLADAYTQLGEAGRATAAVQRMLDLGPGLPSFARASYDLEQRGDTAGARRLLEQALADAYTPADIGFCRYYLGELAFNSGDLAGAATQYDAGLVADPQSIPLAQGRAKTAALRGETAAALEDYIALVARVPNPQYLLEYGELLAKAGLRAEAAAQFALVATEHRLLAANGVTDDLALAEYEADHGSPARALAHARAEWSRRHSAVVADALAWALHKDGRDGEALTYADLALSRGWRNALFLHHRSEIQRALGHSAQARADAASARQVNPRLDPALPAFGRAT